MKHLAIGFLAVLLLTGWVWPSQSESSENEPKYYDNAKVIRVRYVQGEGFVLRSYDEAKEAATLNLPIFENDTLATSDGRMELYLGRMNYLRLDEDSEIQFLKVPALRHTNAEIRIQKGGVYLDLSNLDNSKDIEVQTPDCGIFILEKGIYRINVMDNDKTEVFVYEGLAEVAGDESSKNVRENQKIVMEKGNVKDRPYYFYASEKDDFDLWNTGRNQEIGYSRNSASRYLQNGYEDYEYELTRNGRWNYMSTYGSYVWIPYNIDADWRPYSVGHWVWNPYYGYVWSSMDSWGWFTHHYGRWHWDAYDGWCWVPGYHWSPAWVSWFWDDLYCGWAPLSWWNRPIVIVNNFWDRHYDYRHGIPAHSRSTIIVRKDDFLATHINHVAISPANPTLAIVKALPVQTNPPTATKAALINSHAETGLSKQNSIASDRSKLATESKYTGSSTAAAKYFAGSSSKSSGAKYSSGSHSSSGNPSAPHVQSYKSPSSSSSGTKSSAASGKKKHEDEEQVNIPNESQSLRSDRDQSDNDPNPNRRIITTNSLTSESQTSSATNTATPSFRSATESSTSTAAPATAEFHAPETTMPRFISPARESRAPETTARISSNAPTTFSAPSSIRSSAPSPAIVSHTTPSAPAAAPVKTSSSSTNEAPAPKKK